MRKLAFLCICTTKDEFCTIVKAGPLKMSCGNINVNQAFEPSEAIGGGGFLLVMQQRETRTFSNRLCV